MKKTKITKEFKRDIKKLKKRRKDLNKLYKILESLVSDIKLDPKYCAHKLHGNYRNKMECHIEPDWLLIYEIVKDFVILYRTGSHSDLF